MILVALQSDEDLLAEDLALAKRMLTGRSKHDIIDASYNRYNFHDEGLPEWFEVDERKHMRAPKQVSKEEVNTCLCPQSSCWEVFVWYRPGGSASIRFQDAS